MRRMLVVGLVLLPVGTATACGSEPAEPSRVSIPSVAPTADGPSTIAPSSEPTPTPTRTPTPTADPEPTTEPSIKPTPDGPVTAADLVQQLGAAMSQFPTVRVTYGDDAPPAQLVLDVDLATSDVDLDVVLTESGPPALEVRRVGDRLFFLDPVEGMWAELSGEQLAAAETGALPSIYAFDAVEVLRLALVNATDVEETVGTDVEGVPVTTYELTLDPAAAPAPTFVSAAGNEFENAVTAGRAELSVGEGGLPVRLQFNVVFDASLSQPPGIVRLDFADWGAAIDTTVPPLG